MDGTMAGYYYQAPPNTQHTWVIHMDGGGGCSTKKACEKWAKKGNGAGKKGKTSAANKQTPARRAGRARPEAGEACQRREWGGRPNRWG